MFFHGKTFFLLFLSILTKQRHQARSILGIYFIYFHIFYIFHLFIYGRSAAAHNSLRVVVAGGRLNRARIVVAGSDDDLQLS